MRVEMTKKYIIASLLVVVLLTIGCVATGPATSPALNPAAQLSIIKQTFNRSESGVEVRVKVKNLGPPTAELAEVTVEFYDADGNLISGYNMTDEINKLVEETHQLRT